MVRINKLKIKNIPVNPSFFRQTPQRLFTFLGVPELSELLGTSSDFPASTLAKSSINISRKTT